MCWVLLGMALLWKVMRCAPMPQSRWRQEQSNSSDVLWATFCEWVRKPASVCYKAASKSMVIKWLYLQKVLIVGSILTFCLPLLTFDFSFSLSFLSAQSSSPLRRWQTWCRKLYLTSWSTGLMGGEKAVLSMLFFHVLLTLWWYFLMKGDGCMFQTDLWYQQQSAADCGLRLIHH